MGHPLASRVEALKQRGGIKVCPDSNNKQTVVCWDRWQSPKQSAVVSDHDENNEFDA